MLRWKSENRGKVNSIEARRRGTKLKAMPSWLTTKHHEEIEAFYTEAQRLTTATGIKYHVDHIYPLQGKTSCGLHVPWNLQVLTAAENCSKGNRINLTAEVKYAIVKTKRIIKQEGEK